MISLTEAQELHLCIGATVEGTSNWRINLDRALELASIIVSDIEAEQNGEQP